MSGYKMYLEEAKRDVRRYINTLRRPDLTEEQLERGKQVLQDCSATISETSEKIRTTWRPTQSRAQKIFDEVIGATTVTRIR